MKHSITRYARARTYSKIDRTTHKNTQKSADSEIDEWEAKKIVTLSIANTSGNQAITMQADIRHNSCSVNVTKGADHANAWSPPYSAAAAMKLSATGNSNIWYNAGRSSQCKTSSRVLYQICWYLPCWLKSILFDQILSSSPGHSPSDDISRCEVHTWETYSYDSLTVEIFWQSISPDAPTACQVKSWKLVKAQCAKSCPL